MAIQSVVLKTINESSKDGKTWGMWFIGYYDDTGKPISVKVVSGEKKVKDGGEIWYVAKGWSARDFESLRPHFPEFKTLSANQPPLPTKQAEPDETPFEDAEATPF